jgi:hypothetical protein
MPSALEAVIQRCLEKDRTKRYATIAELSLALAPYGADRAQLSLDRIAQLSRSARGSIRPSAFPPAEQSSSRGRKVPVSWWKTIRWQMAHGKWAGGKGAIAATALGMVGVAMIGSDLILARSSSPRGAPSGIPASAESAAAAQVVGDCRIDLRSVPDSTVSVDGRKIGMTPKLDFVAAPGPHLVLFEHPVHGKLTTSVECKAGETKTVNVSLGRPTDPTKARK